MTGEGKQGNIWLNPLIEWRGITFKSIFGLSATYKEKELFRLSKKLLMIAVLTLLTLL